MEYILKDYEFYKKHYPGVVNLLESGASKDDFMISLFIKEDRMNDVCEFDVDVDFAELSNVFADLIVSKYSSFYALVKSLRSAVNDHLLKIEDAICEHMSQRPIDEPAWMSSHMKKRINEFKHGYANPF